MKRFIILYVLTFILTAHLATHTMADRNLTPSEIIIELRQRIKTATQKAEANQELNIDEVMSYVETVKSEPISVLEAVHKAILIESIAKRFQRYTTTHAIRDGLLFSPIGKTQYYDGTIIENSELQNNPKQSRLERSPWKDLPFEELIRNYSMVYNAQKKELPHPFAFVRSTSPGPCCF